MVREDLIFAHRFAWLAGSVCSFLIQRILFFLFIVGLCRKCRCHCCVVKSISQKPVGNIYVPSYFKP